MTSALQGGTPDWLTTTITIDDAMLERAARVLREEAGEAGIAHTDLHDLARAVLLAALEAH